MTEEVYVACPAYSRSGGPELLHQLVYTINSLGGKSHIAYYGIDPHRQEDPLNDEYRKYIDTYTDFNEIPDKGDIIIVYPEISPNLLNKYKDVKKYFWWMSVDNYLKNFSLNYFLKHKKYKSLLKYLLSGKWRFTLSYIRRNTDLNMAQSYYALDFLAKKGFSNTAYLSDYINDSYMEEVNPSYKSDTVLYNPKKGAEFTQKLMGMAPELHWKPIQNMTRSEVKELLEHSKVYVDFGEHPGKDRFPREAAISGCCVITGRDGSANYDEDIPISSINKFDAKEQNIPAILQRIRECLQNYDFEAAQFQNYRNYILSEKQQFIADTAKIFHLDPEKQ